MPTFVLNLFASNFIILEILIALIAQLMIANAVIRFQQEQTLDPFLQIYLLVSLVLLGCWQERTLAFNILSYRFASLLNCVHLYLLPLLIPDSLV